MKFFLILTLLYTSSSHAVYKEIYAGYKKSDRLKAIEFDEQINAIDKKISESKYDWTLTSSYTDSNSFLRGLFSFNSLQTLTRTTSFELQKPTFKYGTFSLGHSQTAYDLSNWPNTSLSDLDSNVYESRNTLSYSYDFLNKTTQTDFKVIQKQTLLSNVTYRLRYEKDHYDFFTTYLDAKLRVMLDRLYEEFLMKSDKRVKKTKRRVRDGLSRSVEIDQAMLSLLTQKETILRNKSTLREKVSIIEDILGIQFKPEDYKRVNWTYKPKGKFNFTKQITKNMEIERLKYTQEVNELNLKMLKYQSGQALTFGLSYTKNAFDADRNAAVSDAFGSGVNDEKVVSLSYSIPLGDAQYKNQKQKLLELRNKNQLELKNKEGEISVQRKVLNENIARFDNAIQLLNQKINFAKTSLRKHQSLYNRGQASFEELLRAEETLINTEISQMNMFWQYEYALATLSFLNGNIITFLDSYKD